MAADAARRLCSRWADYFNCRLMPHGGPVLFPVVLATLGLCASLADDGCDYARLRGASAEMLTGSAAVPFVDVGMTAYRVPGFYPAEGVWRVAFSDECRPYDDAATGEGPTTNPVVADAPWRAAEWLRFLSAVMGGTAATFLWTAACLALRPNYWRGAGVGTLLACALQACSFVWFRTSLCHTSATTMENFEAGRETEGNPKYVSASSCELFFGSKCSITSCVLYAAAAAAILLRKYPAPVPRLVVRDGNDIANSKGGGPGQPTNPGGYRRDSKLPTTKGGGEKSPRGRSSEMASLTRQSYASGDSSFRPSVRASMRSTSVTADETTDNTNRALGSTNHGSNPASSTRPTELAGSNFSVGSFV